MKTYSSKCILAVLTVLLATGLFGDLNLPLVLTGPVWGCSGGGVADDNNYEPPSDYDIGSYSYPTFWPAGKTYYISDDLTVTNGTLVIEPGAVIKLGNDVQMSTGSGGIIIARGEPYMPIIITSVDDDENGMELNDSDGTPEVGDGYHHGLEVGDDSEVEFCRFLYADTALTINGFTAIPIRHNCFLNCTTAITVNADAVASDESLNIFNNLIVSGDTGIDINTTTEGANMNINNNTIDDQDSYGIDLVGNYLYHYQLENNLITNSGTGINHGPTENPGADGTSDPNIIENNGYYGNTNKYNGISGWSESGIVDLTAGQDPYETGLLGNYYLNDNNPGGESLKDAGNCTIAEAGYEDPCQWAIYHVPDDPCQGGYSSNYTIDYDETWQPNYSLCDSGDDVAIGYHHPRIDCLIDDVRVSVRNISGQPTLTIEPGTVIALNTSSTYNGLAIYNDNDGHLMCNDNPASEGYVTFVRSDMAAQFGDVSTPPDDVGIDMEEGSVNTKIKFTRFWGLGTAINCDGNNSDIMVQDCIFRLNNKGIYHVDSDNSNVQVKNCLFVQNTYGFENEGAYDFGDFENCTFMQDALEGKDYISGTYGIKTTDYSTVTIVNSLFRMNNYGIGGDSTSPYPYSSSSDNKNNAFYSNEYDIDNDASYAANDEICTNDPQLAQTSWQNNDCTGRFYLDQNNSHVIDQGYDPDSYGMPAYTTDIDLDADTTPTDIGYHHPLEIKDTDGDGLKDQDEFWLGTKYDDVDSDDDGLADGSDGYVNIGLVPNGIDKDGDGYVDGETDAGTDPLESDTDDDGIPDGWEYFYTNADPTDDSDDDDDVDGDGLTNLEEYQQGFNPDVDNDGDSWTVYEYDNAGAATRQRQREFRNDTFTWLSETRSEFDDAGRRWQQRQMVNPNGAIDNTNDSIRLYEYNVDGSVDRLIMKGINCITSDAVEAGDLVTNYFYNDIGRKTQIVDPLSQTTSYSYDKVGNATQVELPGGRTISSEYDAAGRMTKEINFLGDYAATSYDSRNHAITQYLYDVAGASTTAVSQQRWYYDGVGDLTRQATMATPNSTTAPSTATDKVTDYENTYNSNKYNYTYTYQGGNTLTSYACSTTSYDYSGRGLPTNKVRGESTDQPSVEQELYYDSSGRVSQSVTVQLDEDGNSSLSTTQQMTYEDHGYTTEEIAVGSTNLTTRYSYDGLGRKISMVNPGGTTTAYAYDAFGRLTRLTEDVGGIGRNTDYVYDRLSRLVYQIGNDGTNAQTTTYDYDKLGRETLVTYPDSDGIAFAYNAYGKVTQRIDQEGITTTYDYDDAGNLLTKHKSASPEEIVVYDYDARSLMVNAQSGDNSGGSTDNISNISFAYDGLGHLTQSGQEVLDSGVTFSIDYTRDQQGHAISTTYPYKSGDTPMTLAYAYTSLGKVDTINRGGYVLADYDYGGLNVRQRIYDTPAVTFTPSYDEFGRMTRSQTTHGGSDIVNFAYTYDADSNIISQHYDHRSSTHYYAYTYDDLDRVTRADYHDNINNENEQFTYDDLGNRLTLNNRAGSDVAYAHNIANEYTSVGGNAVTHDDAGNLTVDNNGYQYSYDYENRLVEVQNSTPATVAEYTYDALGRRIQSITGYTTKRYYYDGWRVLSESSASNVINRNYIYGNYLDEVLILNMGGSFDLYYAHDLLYSPVAFIQSNGDVYERFEYDAYGQQTVYDSSFNIKTSSALNVIAFTGQRLDRLDGNNVDIMYYKNRYYSPTLGRFAQRDPRGVRDEYCIVEFEREGKPWFPREHKPENQYKDGMNVYEYVNAEPITQFDSLGLDAEAMICITAMEILESTRAGQPCCLKTEPFWKLAGYDGVYSCVCAIVGDANNLWWGPELLGGVAITYSGSAAASYAMAGGFAAQGGISAIFCLQDICVDHGVYKKVGNSCHTKCVPYGS